MNPTIRGRQRGYSEKEFTMEEVMREVDLAVEKVKWEPGPSTPERPDAKSFTGLADGWKFCVVSFSIEDQGFPPGSVGYDGAGSNPEKGIAYHMTRMQAEHAVKLAEMEV